MLIFLYQQITIINKINQKCTSLKEYRHITILFSFLQYPLYLVKANTIIINWISLSLS